MGLEDVIGIPGKNMSALAAQSVEWPGGKMFLYGRVKRLEAGPLKVEFGHRFRDPKSVVVLVNANFSLQAGYIETVTKIEAEHFIVTSNNAHYADAFVTWFAIGS
jgi:hypothetical protein